MPKQSIPEVHPSSAEVSLQKKTVFGWKMVKILTGFAQFWDYGFFTWTIHIHSWHSPACFMPTSLACRCEQDPSDRSCNPHLCGWADGAWNTGSKWAMSKRICVFLWGSKPEDTASYDTYVWCVFFWRVVHSLGKLVTVPKCCFASFSLKSLGDARTTEHET